MARPRSWTELARLSRKAQMVHKSLPPYGPRPQAGGLPVAAMHRARLAVSCCSALTMASSSSRRNWCVSTRRQSSALMALCRACSSATKLRPCSVSSKALK
ncbi:hypothetical protein CDD83_8157 [Cordyceps sp. RAO-2017]|nr:hypothetical protein CDD83_8157 [Cordyceps sp. RAO-2017]